MSDRTFDEGAPRARADGFTLIELMIVVAIIAIIASIAIPALMSARKNANESAVIATLRSLLSAQAEMKALVAIDVNRNGNGEYAFFAELAGSRGPRTDEAGSVGTVPVVPLMLPAFGQVSNGHVQRSGYVFRIYLPAAGTGAPVGEAASGGAGGVSVSASLSENVWCAYAWPAAFGNSGIRAFFINQNGDILFTQNGVQRYEGDLNPVPGNAAFRAGTPDLVSSDTAANTLGKDGERWTVVQ